MTIRQPTAPVRDCARSLAALAASLDDGRPLGAGVEEHCRSCPSCARELRLAESASALLRALPRLEPDESLAPRLQRALAVERARRGLPDAALEALGARLLRRAPRMAAAEAVWPRIAARVQPLAARRDARLCGRFHRLVERHLDGELPPGLSCALDHHAARCPTCARGLAAARSARALLRSGRRIELSPSRVLELRRGVTATTAPRYGRALPAVLAAAAVVAIVGLATMDLRQRVASPGPTLGPGGGRAVALAEPTSQPSPDREPSAAPQATPSGARGRPVPAGPPGAARSVSRARARNVARTPDPSRRPAAAEAGRATPDRLEPGAEGAGGQPVLVVAEQGSGRRTATGGTRTGRGAATAIGRVDAETLTL
jgi:hypothetical protein